MIVQSFKEIIAWQKSHQLTLLVYELTDNFPKTELFGLTAQTRRSVVSVPSNIAEGFKRQSRNDSVHFYNIAQGSLEELKYQLLLARDLHYLTADNYEKANILS